MCALGNDGKPSTSPMVKYQSMEDKFPHIAHGKT